jgi:hypothetical protein
MLKNNKLYNCYRMTYINKDLYSTLQDIHLVPPYPDGTDVCSRLWLRQRYNSQVPDSIEDYYRYKLEEYAHL